MYRQCRLLSSRILFVSLFFIPSPVFALININTATLQELDTLPGVGPTTAQYIIDGRPYTQTSQISNVKGIGEPGSKTYEDIIGLITVSGTSPTSEPQSKSQPITQTITSAGVSTSSDMGVIRENPKSIHVDAGYDRTVFVGADSVFEARVTGATGDLITNARVVWSFGNGDRSEGRSVPYHFMYPGEYVVVVDASNELYSATDRIQVTAIPARIVVSDVTPEYIALKNNTDVEVDIGGWLLFSLGKQFQFPLRTILLPGQEVFVSNKRTGLSGNEPSTVVLQYPNGMVAVRYEYPLFLTQGTTVNAPLSRSLAPALPTPAPIETTTTPAHDTTQAMSPMLVVDPNSVGVWPWVALVILFAGTSGVVLVYLRKKRENYTIEEVS